MSMMMTCGVTPLAAAADSPFASRPFTSRETR